MRQLKHLTRAAAVTIVLGNLALPALAQGYYTVNGQPIAYELELYLAGQGVPPGNYRMDGYGNLILDDYRPPAAAQGDSNWNVISPQADYWVGGDGAGCIYTPDWSNC